MRRSFSLLLVLAACVSPFAASAGTAPMFLGFRAIKRTSGIEFHWTRFPHPQAFQSYRIERYTGATSTMVIATTSNRYSTNGVDNAPTVGVDVYRLCVEATTGEQCSKPLGVQVDASEVSTSTDVTSISDPASRPAGSTDPLMIEPAATELALSANTNSSTLNLSWTPLASAAPLFYKVVRLPGNSTPEYPRDGYLAHVDAGNPLSAIDDDPLTGTWSYRVCAVSDAVQLWCGNPLVVIR